MKESAAVASRTNVKAFFNFNLLLCIAKPEVHIKITLGIKPEYEITRFLFIFSC